MLSKYQISKTKSLKRLKKRKLKSMGNLGNSKIRRKNLEKNGDMLKNNWDNMRIGLMRRLKKNGDKNINKWKKIMSNGKRWERNIWKGEEKNNLKKRLTVNLKLVRKMSLVLKWLPKWLKGGKKFKSTENKWYKKAKNKAGIKSTMKIWKNSIVKAEWKEIWSTGNTEVLLQKMLINNLILPEILNIQDQSTTSRKSNQKSFKLEPLKTDSKNLNDPLYQIPIKFKNFCLWYNNISNYNLMQDQRNSNRDKPYQ